MSRPPLQGRVEEIVIREPKPSWGSRIGDVLGDVFSGIGAAVREYGPAVLQGLANASSLYGNSSGSSYSYDASPSSLPDYSSSNRAVRIQAPEPIKPRPLPEPRQTPRLMETYGQSLQEQRTRRQQQIEDLMANNEQAANRRGIAGQLGQYTQPGAHVQPSRRQAPVDFHPSQSSSHSLTDFLNPSSSYSSPIQEDYGWVQDNLARAQRPVSWQEQAMRQQAQQQALHQQQAIDAQIQAAHEQRELAEMQARMLQEQQYQERQALKQYARTARLPESIYRDRVKGPVNVTEQVLQDKVPNDKELEQLFHTLEVAWFQAKNPLSRMQIERNQALVMELLATNMSVGPWANLSKDGYVIIGDKAYGKQEAYDAALADLNHFKKNSKHLPFRYPTRAPRSPRDTHGYPDITEALSQKLDAITRETVLTFHATGKVGVYYLFAQNFPNNGKWDLQVGHGLPGQVPVRDANGNLVPDPKHKGRYLTQDQYAVFNGKVVRSGYISNYAFGQAVAAGEMLDLEGVTAAELVAVWGNRKNLDLKDLGANFDNPEDIQAILEGYKDYRQTHPMQYPTPGSFRNK